MVPAAAAIPSLFIPKGHTLMLDGGHLRQGIELRLGRGLIRVAITSTEPGVGATDPVTLGFLQSGDQLSLELLRHARLHLEAFEPTSLLSSPCEPAEDAIGLCDWTAALLIIQHLGGSEQRLRALIQLLVARLGSRCGGWYELPLRLKHERLAEMVNHTRVTVSRHMARWRQAGLIEVGPAATPCLRFAPALIEGS
ncbi:MAG: helix-turn-helix domain-containing protein [Cyanobium sp.]